MALVSYDQISKIKWFIPDVIPGSVDDFLRQKFIRADRTP